MHYAIVRHPVDRFISTYINFCVMFNVSCYQCDKYDIACIIERNYYSFLAYPSKTEHTMWAANHVQPQNWFCNFKEHLLSYKILKYDRSEKFYNEMVDIFHQSGVNDNVLDSIQMKLHMGTTSHETVNSYHGTIQWVKKVIRSNHALKQILYNTYYYDFKLFGFNPTV